MERGLDRRLGAEFIGTAFLLATVVGSGIMAENLAGGNIAVALLEAEPTRPIADIAGEVGVSHGHLNREFTRIVGMSPRSLAGLLRMRRLLASIDPTQPQAWAEHAARWGWFDQAHLNRDFKRHTGVTPTAYLAAQHAWFDGMPHVPGFVPDGERDPT